MSVTILRLNQPPEATIAARSQLAKFAITHIGDEHMIGRRRIALMGDIDDGRAGANAQRRAFFVECAEIDRRGGGRGDASVARDRAGDHPGKHAPGHTQALRRIGGDRIAENAVIGDGIGASALSRPAFCEADRRTNQPFMKLVRVPQVRFQP